MCEFPRKLESLFQSLYISVRAEYYHKILAEVFRTLAEQYFLSEKGQQIRTMSATLFCMKINFWWSESRDTSENKELLWYIAVFDLMPAFIYELNGIF